MWLDRGQAVSAVEQVDRHDEGEGEPGEAVDGDRQPGDGLLGDVGSGDLLTDRVEGTLQLGAGRWLLGVPLVVPLAVLTFFGAFLPLVGAVLTGFLAAIVAQGPLVAVAVVRLAVLSQQLEDPLLGPFTVKRLANTRIPGPRSSPSTR
jgi:hypothetical protein